MPDPRPPPGASYRLQLRSGFGFAEAAALADYLAGLGVTHVYLSPVLQAAPGSPHGYDVTDHSRISAELGGEAGFRAMVARFRRHGLGVIADVVPNHMAVPVPEYLNRQLWSVLREGPGSPCAHWFDIDWAAQQGRLLLPILAGPPGDCLGDLTVARVPEATDEPVLRYFGHVLPLRAGTAGLPVPRLIEAQHYRLADWRLARTELNWRRFFDISTLIAIRAEDPGVFAATHRLLLALMAEGLIDGLRVDHPDGLADPRGYLARLAEATGGAWVAAEKILGAGEELPADWRCAGTTGYDALAMVTGVFLDPAGEQPLTAAHARFTGTTADFAGAAAAAKRETAVTGLAAELTRLAGLLARAAGPALASCGPGGLKAILAELLAACPVYRAYVYPGEPAPSAAEAVIGQAVAAARRELPARLHAALATVGELVLGRGGAEDAEDAEAAAGEFVVRFQQACGAVMAKGVEDTAYYRWVRLAALNEVGGDPGRFGVSVAEFHEFAGRVAAAWPATMTTLSTHDTKRQEDVRARLSVLAELPGEWEQAVAAWHERAGRLAAGPPPEAATEYLCWQTMVGAWPVSGDRLASYLRKAMREAKTRTSWTEPGPDYEQAVLEWAGRALGDPWLSAAVAGFAGRIRPAARANSLGAKLVQLTMPGVADVYQGCELGGFSLVDPDNRRPVDFARRRRMLAAMDEHAQAAPGAAADAEKLLVTAAALRLRRDHPDWFGGSYQPAAADGPAAGHVLAFTRGPAVTVATRLPAGLARRAGWADTALPLPGGPWRDVLTGTLHRGARLPLAELTRWLPVALLVPAEDKTAAPARDRAAARAGTPAGDGAAA